MICNNFVLFNGFYVKPQKTNKKQDLSSTNLSQNDIKDFVFSHKPRYFPIQNISFQIESFRFDIPIFLALNHHLYPTCIIFVGLTDLYI